MKCIWLEAGALQHKNVPTPQPAQGECLLAIKQAGICGTDRELLRGYYNFQGIAGHEFVATVERGSAAWQDKRVVADINISCEVCEHCSRGLQHHCPQRRVIGIKDQTGAFAEYMCIPERNLFELPASMSDYQAVQLEPLAAALQILDQIALDATDRVLVVGAGRLGRMVCRVLKTRGQKVSVLVRDKAKVAKTLDGIDVLSQADLGSLFNIVIECTGHQDGMALALAAIEPRGTIVVKSTYANPLTIDMSQLVVNEISLVGSRCGDLGKAISWMVDNGEEFDLHLNNDKVHAFALSEYQQAFDEAANTGLEKVIFNQFDR